MFENRRKQVMVEPSVTAPAEDPFLREEKDPDPLIEEMVQRLRDGLSSLNAFDEWGRPIAWRNVVRLAVGPLSSRLRDAETAAVVAAHLNPPAPAPEAEPVVLSDAVTEAVQEAVHDAVHEAVAEAVHDAMLPEPGAVRYGVAAVASRPLEDVAVDEAVLEPNGAEAFAAESGAVEAVAEAMETLSELASEEAPGLAIAPVASQTEAWVAPEAEIGQYDEAPAEPAAAEPSVVEPAQGELGEPQASAAPEGVGDVAGHVHLSIAPVSAVPPVTSIFRVSGDERPAVTRGPGELVERRGTHDATTAKYDRFLTGLYGDRRQSDRSSD